MSYTTGKSSQADNITMSGGGVYSLATAGAKDVIKKKGSNKKRGQGLT